MKEVSKGKSPQSSMATMTEMVMPQHANALGAIFGGVLMGWIDICGAIAASRHAGRICVTASIDELHFMRPVKIGSLVKLEARVTAVHRTSCEVWVNCEGERVDTEGSFHIAHAYLTFVSVDEAGHPIEMPRLLVKTAQEKKLQQEGLLRRAHRMKFKKLLTSRT